MTWKLLLVKDQHETQKHHPDSRHLHESFMLQEANRFQIWTGWERETQDYQRS